MASSLIELAKNRSLVSGLVSPDIVETFNFTNSQSLTQFTNFGAPTSGGNQVATRIKWIWNFRTLQAAVGWDSFAGSLGGKTFLGFSLSLYNPRSSSSIPSLITVEDRISMSYASRPFVFRNNVVSQNRPTFFRTDAMLFEIPFELGLNDNGGAVLFPSGIVSIQFEFSLDLAFLKS